MLAEHLQADEALLAHTRGQHHHEAYLIGLTAERLLLLPLENEQLIGAPLSLSRHRITSLKWSGWFRTLRARFNQDELTFKCTGAWKEKAGVLVKAHAQTPVPPKVGEAAPRLPQIEGLHQLGLLNMARTELERAVQLDPSLTGDPLFDPLRRKITEQSLALRVAGGFFLITLTILVGLALPGIVRLNLVGIFIFLLVGVNLWQRQPHWRGGGILLGLLNVLIFGIDFYNTDGLLGALTWVAFGAAVVLVLTGQSNRRRTRTALGIYAVGHIGLLALLVITP